MGYYVNRTSKGVLLPIRGKASALIEAQDAVEIPKPINVDEGPDDMAVLVAVENEQFDAVGYAFDQSEFEAFTLPDDPRCKRFLWMKKDLAIKLTDYKELE